MAVIIDGDLGVDKIKDGSVTSNDLASTVALGVRNLIINGDMRIDQRNAGTSVTTTNTFPYTVDRWQVGGTNNSKFTAQQNSGSVTPPVDFTNYMGMVSSSAYTPSGSEEYDFRQSIEANNMQHLAWGTSDAKTITLSFWVRSSLTGTFGGALFNYAGNYSYPFTYTISSANTWEQKSITIEGPTAGSWNTGNTGFVWINFSLGAGSTVKGTAGSWSANYYAGATGQTEIVGTSGATLYITGIQLEVGDTATPFEHRPYDMELARCQRYYYKRADVNTKHVGMADYFSSTIARCGIDLPVTMRTIPSLDIVSGTNYYRISRNGGSDYMNTLSMASESTENFAVIQNSSEVSGTGGQCGFLLTSNSSAFIGFSAEL